MTLRGRRLLWGPGHPVIMGVVNVGSDSFSDSGPPPTIESAIELGMRLAEDGAQIVDVGGESGVTYTSESSPADEAARVVPVIRRLVDAGVVVSVDTYKSEVAAAALEAGAHLINDVSGLLDPVLADQAAAAGAGLVVMHTRAEPKQATFPVYDDVFDDVTGFLSERRAVAVERGVDPAGILLDPGPDFAKSPADTIEVLRRARELTALASPWLAAVSRKYFQAAIVTRPPAERGALTLAAVAHAADHGAAVVRVHDVVATADLLAARDVLSGRTEPQPVDRDDERLKWNRRS